MFSLYIMMYVNLLLTLYVLQIIYGHLNHMNVCVSYDATIKLVETFSKLHMVPLHQWIEEGVTFKF